MTQNLSWVNLGKLGVGYWVSGVIKPEGGLTTVGLAPKQPPAGYKGLVGIGCLEFKEDVAAVGIRNLREVWRVRRAGKYSKPEGGKQRGALRC
jgi:hypothetical protein